MNLRTIHIQERSVIGRSFRFWFICLIGLLIVAGCQPEATPVANVVPPTNTPDTTETLTPPIRYVLGPNSQNMTSIETILATDGLLIPSNSLTQESQLGVDYDVIADYGQISGWQQSPVVPTVSLVINPNLSPLNDDTITNIISNGVDGVRIINQTNISGTIPLAISTIQLSSLKTEFANMGYPDGFQLQMSIAEIPNNQSVITELNNLNIDLNITEATLETIASQLVSNRVHLAVIKWHTVSEKAVWTSAVGENNVIDLYQMPISYLATPNLTITYADNGFPLASY